MKKFAVILALLLTSPAVAESKFTYVDPVSISPEFLDPPLKTGSKELEAETQQVINAQKDVSSGQIVQALYESKMRVDIVSKTIDSLSSSQTPKTIALLNNVAEDCHNIVHQAKDFWHTERPYNVSKSIKALIPKLPENNYAYPSGHTACSLVLTEVLGQLYPQKREELKQKADEIANNRMLSGVHWPNDLKGGKQLGWMMFGALQQSAAYQADLENAKSEIKK
jgi:acid phosphatase (class A)